MKLQVIKFQCSYHHLVDMYPVALNKIVFNCTMTPVKSVRGSLDTSVSGKGISSIQSFIPSCSTTTEGL